MSKKSKAKSLQIESDDDDNDCFIIDTVPAHTKKKDVPHVKVGSTKKITQWVSSSFGDFGDSARDINKPQNKSVTSNLFSRSAAKRSHDEVSCRSSNFDGKKALKQRTKVSENELWSDKYSPTTQADLAVHKKKIGEVSTWLNDHVQQKRGCPILLLTGQAGCGKTATVRVLAKELDCELQEWANPMTEDSVGYDRDRDWRSYSRSDVYTSQLSKFEDFLLRANKYNTLDIFGGSVFIKKIIFVEELPNVIYRDTATFHRILRKYVQVGGSPLVFSISDSTSGESNERKLFPKDIQSELDIHNISFNPIAMTIMTKILTKIATEESKCARQRFTIPPANVIESIAMASSGDIRGAIHALQFACLKDTGDLSLLANTRGVSKTVSRTTRAGKKQGGSKKTGMSKQKSFESDGDMAAIGGRDTSLFLFRAIGKILYCKRGEAGTEKGPDLPTHLAEHKRDPLLLDPEDVIERSHLSGDYFGAYLHQNYLDFFTSVEDVLAASIYLSDADYLAMDWASRSVLQQYAASVATRGILHSNTARAHQGAGTGGMGWKPLHKPMCYTTAKTARMNCETARHLFKLSGCTPVVQQTELIPFSFLIRRNNIRDTGQRGFVLEMCRFSNSRTGRYERLDEKDVDLTGGEDDGPEETQTEDQSTGSENGPSLEPMEEQPALEEEEEWEIEEFED